MTHCQVTVSACPPKAGWEPDHIQAAVRLNRSTLAACGR